MLVLVNLPFALVGGVIAVFLTGGWLSLGALVGFVTLFGISTRNSIMMISHFEHLVQAEGHHWNLKTAVEGAIDRFSPVMMTALVTALGLAPIAFHAAHGGGRHRGFLPRGTCTAPPPARGYQRARQLRLPGALAARLSVHIRGL